MNRERKKAKSETIKEIQNKQQEFTNKAGHNAKEVFK